MAGYNANFRNTGTDKNYRLPFIPEHGSGAVTYIPDPLQGLFEIECGDIVTRTLDKTVFKSLFRTDDVRENQRYYSWIGTFRIDDPSTVFLYVRSASFLTHVVVWRSAVYSFFADPSQSTDVERVFEINVTDETSGVFIVEVSSMAPYATGEFEVELVCASEPLIGLIKPGSTQHGYAYTAGPPSWPSINPPGRGYSFANYNLATALALFGYTWTHVSGSMGGLSMNSAGTMSGTINQIPNWATFPANGRLPWPEQNQVGVGVWPAHADWDDAMYEAEWRGFNRMSTESINNVNGPFMNLKFTANLATLGVSPPLGNRIVSIPVLVDLIQSSWEVTLPNPNGADIRVATFPPEVDGTAELIRTGINCTYGHDGTNQVDAGVSFHYTSSGSAVKIHIGFKAGSGWIAVACVLFVMGGFPGFPVATGTYIYRSSYQASPVGGFTCAFIGTHNSHNPNSVWLDTSINPADFLLYGESVGSAQADVQID